jgi:hypothetical protein
MIRKLSVVPTKYYQKDGIIHFDTSTEGTEGEDWIPRLECCGLELTNAALLWLHSPEFTATSGVTSRGIIIPGRFFPKGERTSKHFDEKAQSLGFWEINAELSCLTRYKFSVPEELQVMGLEWIHSTEGGYFRSQSLLNMIRGPDGQRFPERARESDFQWEEEDGLVYTRFGKKE